MNLKSCTSPHRDKAKKRIAENSGNFFLLIWWENSTLVSGDTLHVLPSWVAGSCPWGFNSPPPRYFHCIPPIYIISMVLQLLQLKNQDLRHPYHPNQLILGHQMLVTNYQLYIPLTTSSPMINRMKKAIILSL